MNAIFIEPYVGCGPIKAGDDYSTIKTRFPSHQEFKKSPISKFVTSSLCGDSLHIFYSETGACTGVEIFRPLRALLEGIDLMEEKLDVLKERFVQKGVGVSDSDYGFELPSLGVSLYSHDFEGTSTSLVDSVFVHLEPLR
jgi:hypothetical protein